LTLPARASSPGWEICARERGRKSPTLRCSVTFRFTSTGRLVGLETTRCQVQALDHDIQSPKRVSSSFQLPPLPPDPPSECWSAVYTLFTCFSRSEPARVRVPPLLLLAIDGLLSWLTIGAGLNARRPPVDGRPAPRHVCESSRFRRCARRRQPRRLTRVHSVFRFWQ
jgi:hypothetical protein